MRNYQLFAFLLLFVLGCQQDGCNTTKFSQLSGAPIGKGVDLKLILNKRGTLLMSTCYLVPVEEIGAILGVDPKSILIKDSTPRTNNPSHASCFFKFEDPNVVSAGIMLQIMKSPEAGEEFALWAEKTIESKILFGEQTVEGDVDKFKAFEGFGESGAYSYKAARYFWNIGNKLVFSIAFNTAHTPDQQYDIAQKLATKMTLNYLN